MRRSDTSRARIAPASGRSVPTLLVLACVALHAVEARAETQFGELPGAMRVAQAPEGIPPGLAPYEPPVEPPAEASMFRPLDLTYSATDCVACAEPWTWQMLPDGLIYRSYLAGQREPRLAALFDYDRTMSRWLVDGTVGGRVALFRYGTINGLRPEGWEFDVEGAAFPRLDLSEESDVEATDYRAGALLTRGVGKWQSKFGYYHLSSHLGDEFMLKNPNVQRINYVRDSLVLGIGYYLIEAIRLYGEAGWAFNTDGGARPWEFQFGAEFSPVYAFGFRGAPFAAINGHLRQENDFGGNLAAQIGWQWIGETNGSRLRTGFQYFNGKSAQTQFFRSFEELYTIGIWYDY